MSWASKKKWSSSFSFVSEFSLVKLTKMMSWSHARVERRLGGMQLAQILYKRQDKTAQIHQHLPSTIIYYESSKIFKENCCGICNSSNIYQIVVHVLAGWFVNVYNKFFWTKKALSKKINTITFRKICRQSSWPQLEWKKCQMNRKSLLYFTPPLSLGWNLGQAAETKKKLYVLVCK